MQYQMVGLLWGVVPKEYKNKQTGEVTKSFCEVTVEQIVIDANGFRTKDIEKVNFDQVHYNDLKKNIDKHISIPMEYRQWQKDGKSFSAMMMSEGAVYTIHDKNPLETKKPA